jgi:hypothetical protein
MGEEVGKMPSKLLVDTEAYSGKTGYLGVPDVLGL